MLENLVCYKKMPVWCADTLPKMFQEPHNTQAGTWAKLTIFEGSLRFFELDEMGNVLRESLCDSQNPPPMIAPQMWHKVGSASDDLRCQLAFYCEQGVFFQKKYNLTATHSEVREAIETISPCKTLDLGCGRGRNALFLSQKGFDVTAWDHNALSIDFLRDVAEKEQLAIKTAVYDINRAEIQENYDFILSTVVMMFLNPERIPAIIENMQAHTNVGGYNLIVVAMDTEDYPCVVGFSSPFHRQALAEYYKDWVLLKYNEEVGELHRVDANGNRIKLRFATMLAKKLA